MRPHVLLASGLALFIAAPAMAESEKAYQADMLARLHKAVPTATFTPQTDDPFAITITHGPDQMKEGTINLHRIFSYCQNAPKADCTAAKEEFVATLTAPVPVETKADLRVIVRDKEYRDYSLGLFAKEPGRAPLTRQIGDDLFEILAFDTPETIRLAGPEDLKKYTMSIEEAWALGEAQTAKIISPPPSPEDITKGTVSLEGPAYVASALVQKSAWESLAKSVGPDLFMTVVSDHFVFVGITPDGPNFDARAKAVKDDCKEQQRCVSPHIYRWRDGMWKIAR
jgi:hypothetical protein